MHRHRCSHARKEVGRGDHPGARRESYASSSGNGVVGSEAAAAAAPVTLAASGIVLDRTQLLAALRLALPQASGIAPIDNGAFYAILFEPDPERRP